MSDLNTKIQPGVEEVFSAYPEFVRQKMLDLRELILESAEEMPEISEIELALKWGEPGFITKIGSTLRIDWKEKSPDQYALYFKCTSRLVDTFRMVFGDTFNYEGNRAIVFKLNDSLPVPELRECVKAALRYHKVKHLETLGIN